MYAVAVAATRSGFGPSSVSSVMLSPTSDPDPMREAGAENHFALGQPLAQRRRIAGLMSSGNSPLSVKSRTKITDLLLAAFETWAH